MHLQASSKPLNLSHRIKKRIQTYLERRKRMTVAFLILVKMSRLLLGLFLVACDFYQPVTSTSSAYSSRQIFVRPSARAGRDVCSDIRSPVRSR